MPAVEMDNEMVRELLGSAVPTLSDYSIGFALPTATNGVLDATLGGSGTLVTIDEVQGILTANHVIQVAQDEQGCWVSSSNSKQGTSPCLIQIERFYSSFVLPRGRT